MDYVVFGIGFGATLLVVGLVIRDFGPRLRFRNPTGADGVYHAEELVARVSWGRFCGALGMVLAIAGLAFVLATGICMLFTVSDARAGWVMGVSLLTLVVAIAFWTWAYFDRFGSYGILPEREIPDDAGATETSSPARDTVVAPSVPAQDGGSAQVAAASDDPDATAHVAPEPEATNVRAHAEEEASEKQESPPPDGAHPDTTTHEPQPLPTPEERIASSTSTLDHESAEAELDTPTQTDSRHRRRGTRAYVPKETTTGDPETSEPDEHEVGTRDQDDADGSGAGAQSTSESEESAARQNPSATDR